MLAVALRAGTIRDAATAGALGGFLRALRVVGMRALAICGACAASRRFLCLGSSIDGTLSGPVRARILGGMGLVAGLCRTVTSLLATAGGAPQTSLQLQARARAKLLQ